MTGKRPFEVVVAEHGATVLRVCRAVLGPADAEDAWSETFLAALKAYPQLPADANGDAWLVTVPHRQAIDLSPAAGRPRVPAPRGARGGAGCGLPDAGHPRRLAAARGDEAGAGPGRLPRPGP